MKFILVSSREPSGATWLINCLLELGIKTYRRAQPDWMWQLQSEGHYTLNPEEAVLKRWLPILSKSRKFHFRSDIEVQWIHDYPLKQYSQYPAIYFARDPRDSIYSRYKREHPDLTFDQFIQLPDPVTLLDKIDNWVLFNSYWMKWPNLNVIRFEDYKSDPTQTLNSVLTHLGIKEDGIRVQEAIDASTFEQAKKAEQDYHSSAVTNPKVRKRDGQMSKWVVTRAGKAAEWKNHSEPDNTTVFNKISERTIELLKKFNYEIPVSTTSVEVSYFYPNTNLLSFFKSLKFNPEEVVEIQHSSHNLEYLVDWVQQIEQNNLQNLGMLQDELELLLITLIEFFQALVDEQKDKTWIGDLQFKKSMLPDGTFVRIQNASVLTQEGEIYFNSLIERLNDELKKLDQNWVHRIIGK